jgi:hypothetical protein
MRPLMFLAVTTLFACGPVRSTAHLVDADVQLEAARMAGAPRYAPYEYTASTLFLEKAREEVGYADYDVAVRFAERAARFAKEAKEKALIQKQKEDGLQ